MIAFDAAVTAQDIAEVEANITDDGSIAKARRISLSFLTIDSATLLKRFQKVIADDPKAGVSVLKNATTMAADFLEQAESTVGLAKAVCARLEIIAHEIVRQNPA